MTTITPTYTDTTTADDARELFCGDCGYGIVVRREPPSCPMCRGGEWQARPRRTRWN